MTFSRKDHEPGIRNFARKLMGRIPVGSISRSVMFIVADQDERGNRDFPQAAAMVVFLAREYEVEIIFERGNAGHPDLQKVLDQIRVGRGKFARPAGFNRMFPDVAFEPEPYHVTAHTEWNAARPGMR